MLYKRIVGYGTLSEPEGVPEPQFALPSTINWMRALAILTDHHAINFKCAQAFYSKTGRRSFAKLEENTIMEQLLFSLHQLSAMEALQTIPRRSDVARVAIVTWYYGIYYAASAMIAAQDATFQEDHAGTANAWDKNIAERGLAIGPFGLRVSTLVEKDAKAEVQAIRAEAPHDLKTVAQSPLEAWGACCTYLSGSAGWYRWRITEGVRQSKEFKALGVSDFRTRAARELRDQRLARRGVGFIHQTFRYRGKANYREALFLGYGNSTETLLLGYIDDLSNVLRGFVAMAGALVSRRIDKTLWGEFIADVEAKRAFSLSPLHVWS